MCVPVRVHVYVSMSVPVFWGQGGGSEFSMLCKTDAFTVCRIRELGFAVASELKSLRHLFLKHLLFIKLEMREGWGFFSGWGGDVFPLEFEL